jgi:hypothetical protein
LWLPVIGISLLAAFCWQNYYHIKYYWNRNNIIQRIFQSNLNYFLQYGNGLFYKFSVTSINKCNFQKLRMILTCSHQCLKQCSNTSTDTNHRDHLFAQMSGQPSRHIDLRAHVRCSVRTANWRLRTVKTACNCPDTLLKTLEEKCVFWSRLLLDVWTSSV